MKKIGIKLKFNIRKPMVKHKKSMNYESILVKLCGNQLKGLGWPLKFNGILLQFNQTFDNKDKSFWINMKGWNMTTHGSNHIKGGKNLLRWR
jgi:hypothetical protein